MKFVALFTGLLGLLLTLTAHAQPVIITDVQGHTLSDGSWITFEALAFKDDRVLAVGKSSDLKKRFANATIIAGKNRVLLPGLIDAHGHILNLGHKLSIIDLTGLSRSETLETITRYAKTSAPDEWLIGRGWNQELWQDRSFPTRAMLDAIDADRPIWFVRVDGHAGWANSKALQLAGITKESIDPAGGQILRDSRDQPNGIVVDNAMALIERVIPEISDDQQKSRLIKAMQHILSLGITSVHDAGISGHNWRLFQELHNRQRLPLRIYAMLGVDQDDFAQTLTQGLQLDEKQRLVMRSIKISADGALGSRGAALLKPYSDQPKHHGLMLHSKEKLDEFYRDAMAKGFQVNVHAIGDKANRVALDLFAKHGHPELRHRIEHAQVVSLKDIPRFKELGLIASMQPIHATSDMNMAEDRVGSERIKGAYAWQTFLGQNTPIAAGSDFPVEPVNPFYGLHAAVTRQSRDGQPPEGWFPKQRLSVEAALRAFTLDAAFAAHQEKDLGSLEPGKFADFILVDQDPFAVAAEDLWKINVLETWVAGKRVYLR